MIFLLVHSCIFKNNIFFLLFIIIPNLIDKVIRYLTKESNKYLVKLTEVHELTSTPRLPNRKKKRSTYMIEMTLTHTILL